MYDCIIIGAGPAGLSAAINCCRGGLKTAVFEKLFPGGQMASANEIENYPGFNNIGGAELALKMAEQAKAAGAELIIKEITAIESGEKAHRVYAGEGFFEAKSVILAMGGLHRKLGIPGEDRFLGHGVSYCATCDGAFFKGLPVMVVGGGDTALGDALYLKNLCEKVYILHRRQEFRAAAISVRAAKNAPNIEFILDSVALEISGLENKAESVLIKNTVTEKLSRIFVNGVFIAAGSLPQTGFPLGGVIPSGSGYIKTSDDCETGIPGIFAAGDVREKLLYQIMTAVSDGAVCARKAIEYCSGIRHTQ